MHNKKKYPSNAVINIFKISKFFYQFRLTKIFATLLYYLNRFIFNCVIPPKANIHNTVHFGLNGFGNIINSLSKIDRDVYLGANVLIGGDAKNIGAPHIKKNCIIFSNATILGPITIGENCVIAAGSIVLKDVPDNSLVAGIPSKIIKKNIDVDEYNPFKKKKIEKFT